MNKSLSNVTCTSTCDLSYSFYVFDEEEQIKRLETAGNIRISIININLCIYSLSSFIINNDDYMYMGNMESI